VDELAEEHAVETLEIARAHAQHHLTATLFVDQAAQLSAQLLQFLGP
jgi:hypothetical protein